jgi:hypothetical protein
MGTIEQICGGRCNNAYRKAVAAYETAVTEWMDAEETYPHRLDAWQNAVAQMGEEAAGPAPQRRERPAEPDIRPWYGEPIWCRGCKASITRCLSDLEDLMSLRLAMTDGYEQPGRHGERVTGSKEQRSQSPAQDDLDDVVRWLVGWENAYRQSQGARMASYVGTNAPALMTVVSRLMPLLDAILAHPDLAQDFGEEVFREHARLQRLTTTRPALRRKPLPCPKCEHLSLFLRDDETVRCAREQENCGLIMSPKEYERYEAQMDAAYQQRAS